jgi:hypothetical protein
MNKTTIALLSVGLLAGCAAPKEPDGFPMTGQPPEINQVNVPDLTNDIMAEVTARFGPKDGTVTVGGDNQIVSDELVHSLKANRYRVVEKNSKHSVLYAIAPLGPTLLVTERIDDQRSAQLYKSGPTGELVKATPTTITER